MAAPPSVTIAVDAMGGDHAPDEIVRGAAQVSLGDRGVQILLVGDAPRIIHGVWRLDVRPRGPFPSPVTLIPSYPNLPMEDVYPRVPRTETREAYLRPGDVENIGVLTALARDTQVTTIGAEGGRATDSRGQIEVNIPPGKAVRFKPGKELQSID